VAPSFRKSPAALVARFEQLANLVGDAGRKQMFGYPTCVLRGNMFMGLHQESMILRLSDADRREFLERYDTGLFEPMPGRAMKEYVVVPPSLIETDDVEEWVRRSFSYAEKLPAKPAKKRPRPGLNFR
jgi:TfoX/Sxy family transcriptional regulator of competence genes